MNNYSTHDELAEMQGKDFAPHTWHQDKQAYSDRLLAGKAALNDYVNDHSQMLRGDDGKVHTEYQENTMVSIGGVEMTYGTAVRCGLIDDESIETNEHTSEKEEFGVNHVPDIAPLSGNLAGQELYAINAAGDDVYEAALMGSENALSKLAEKAGASVEDTQRFIRSTMGHYINAGLNCASELLGEGGDLEHVRDYFVSSAVTPAQRRTLLQTVRRGDISGVFHLVERYKAHYGM